MKDFFWKTKLFEKKWKLFFEKPSFLKKMKAFFWKTKLFEKKWKFLWKTKLFEKNESFVFEKQSFVKNQAFWKKIKAFFVLFVFWVVQNIDAGEMFFQFTAGKFFSLVVKNVHMATLSFFRILGFSLVFLYVANVIHFFFKILMLAAVPTGRRLCQLLSL